MGKLAATQAQVEDFIGNTIGQAEDYYLSLTAKPFEIANKFHAKHDRLIKQATDQLRRWNVDSGKLAMKLIVKLEGEETKSVKAKRSVNRAGAKAKSNVKRSAKKAKAYIDKMDVEA